MIRATSFFILLLFSAAVTAQPETIRYESNGFHPTKNPFATFIGEWTLQHDRWTQNWGTGKEEITIPHHHTISTAINTDLTLLSIIDGPQPNGHIFWSYDPASKTFHHLSSFGTSRFGTGKGTVNEKGDLSIRISFSDEAKGTYRLYRYTWIDENTYTLMSDQYNEHDQPTGLFYGGTFVRVR